MHNFLSKCLNELDPILSKHWEIDHACFRTSSLAHYQKTKEYFSSIGELLIESPIAGRPIATYRLEEAFVQNSFVINVVEVPAPKTGRNVDEGYEHIEIVCDLTFTELQEKYPQLHWNTRALGKGLNPELEANFKDFNVKFHYHALSHIINIEKHSLANEFISHCNLFEEFHEYSPLISGTIPLAINIDHSDLDILFHVQDFDRFSHKVISVFPEAQIKKTKDYIVANLSFKGLPIEFYAQNLHPLKQNAHRHLRVEGRLLKLLGEEFKQKVVALKRRGHKTEPAFGQVLELSNPYEELLELYYYSDIELMQRFNQNCAK